MKKQIVTAMAAAAIVTSLGSCSKTKEEANPFLAEYNTEYDIPPFDKISIEHYVPAFTKGVEEARADIAAIVANEETPTFENTIVAMDNAGATLDRVSRVFFSLSEADSSPEMEEIAKTVTPMISRYYDEVSMNDSLFNRVKYLYEHSEALDAEQKRAVEESYKDFVRNGALLSAEDKAKLSELNVELSDLYLKFNQNLLAATNDFAIIVKEESRLSGLPEGTIATAAAEAEKRGEKGAWAFTLHAPSRLAVLQYADDRQLRQDMYVGYSKLASEGEYDNRPVINDILRVRSAKAKLLGYANYASYMTDKVMAKTPQNALDLLMKVWTPTVKQVKAEVAEMQQLADERGDNLKIEPWDYYYYAEKVRVKKYDLDENEVRQYFQVDSVRKGIFTLAERLYGVKFVELPDAPKYHPDVKVYEVVDLEGNHVAVFMTDFFTRPSKRQGAWMDEMKSSYVAADGTAVRPIVYNVCNFAAPTAEMPSLLSLDDVATMFHEFGHGLHGMLSRAKYKCQSGTAVDRDFVELPSQLTEHWALEPELLKVYARHYKTGEVIPDELVAKLQAASRHNAGFNMAERVAASYLDLQYGLMDYTEDVDINAFEEKVVEELGMPREVEYRYHSTYFKHIFGSDGYASGYYTYLWAEVLDADAFELFAEKGAFDPETARSFKENVLEKGGSEDPMELYVKFRGQEPNAEALLRKHGLDK
ncbi:MAG: M3 family metallopeptidase [Muribaculaceae bacterium]|nr:M3 family metallopeptidase [Muribaculaceae bacterium]